MLSLFVGQFAVPQAAYAGATCPAIVGANGSYVYASARPDTTPADCGAGHTGSEHLYVQNFLALEYPSVRIQHFINGSYVDIEPTCTSTLPGNACAGFSGGYLYCYAKTGVNGNCNIGYSYVDNGGQTVSLSFTVPPSSTTIPSFTVNGGNYEPDTTKPTLSETTVVPTPDSDRTPNYTFITDELGTITYGGACSSATTAASVGSNTITFDQLGFGTHSNCTITVTDASGNASDPLAITPFEVAVGPPASIVINSNPRLHATVNTAFPPAPATVNDANGNPVSGVTVTFTMPSAGPSGTFAGGNVSATAVTNASGIATTPTLTANTQASGYYSMEVKVNGLPLKYYSPKNFFGADADIIAYNGTPQSAEVTMGFAGTFKIQIVDEFGNGTATKDQSVQFSAPASGASGTFENGSINAASVLTDTGGRAKSSFLTANGTVGTYNVTATLGSFSTTFAVENTVDVTPPAAPTIVSLVADSGALTSGDATSDTSLVLTGTAEPNSSVTVANGGSTLATGVAVDGNGDWQITLNLGAGSYSIISAARDAAGNTGTTSPAFAVTIDLTAPTILSFSRLTPAQETTNADTLAFQAIFSEAVKDVDDADFIALNTTASAAVTKVNDTTYNVTLSGGSLAGLNGTVGLNISGTVSIADLAGNALAVGEPSIDQTYSMDNLAPVLAEVTAAPSPTNSSPSAYTFSSTEAGVFSRDGDCNSDTTVATAGNNTIDVKTHGNGNYNNCIIFVTDAAGNKSVALLMSLIVVDINAPAAPAITGVIADTGALTTGDSTNDTTLTVNGTAEANSLVTVANGGDTLAQNILVDGSGNWTTDLTLAQGTYDFTATATDLAGNTGSASTAFTVTIDTVAPTVLSFSRLTPTQEVTNLDTLIIQAIFSEAVKNVDAADFVEQGSNANISVAEINDTTYNITLTGGNLAGLNGIAGLNLSGSVSIADLGGSPLTGGEPTTDETYQVDNSAPVLTVVAQVASPTNNPTPKFTFNSTQAGTLVHSGACSSSATSATVGSNLITFSTLADGTYANCGLTVTDPAGNASNTLLADGFTVDTTAPAAPVITTVTADNGALNSGDPTNDTTLAVSGTAEPKSYVRVTIAGTATSVDVAVDSSGNWTVATITLPEGSQNIVATGQDEAGNIGPNSTPFAVTLDTGAPVLNAFARLTPADAATNADTLIFRATFSEPVTNISAGSFTPSAAGATVTDISPSGATNFDITVSGGTLASFSGVIELNLAAGQAIRDKAGNLLPGTEPATDQQYTLDNDVPTITIQNVPAIINSSFVATFKFSESVSQFVVGEIDVTNATLSEFAGTGDTYTARVTPTTDGPVTIDVAAGVVKDSVGNDNTVATQAIANFDGTLPSVKILNVPATGNSPFTVTFSFTETVTDFELGDITVGNGTASGLAGTGTTYTALITPASDGTVTIDVAANVAIDIAGNGNNAALQAASGFDGTAPSVAITGAPASSNGTPFSVTITFSEDIGGFVEGDIAIANGATSNFLAVSRSEFTLDVTPTGAGDITIDIAAGAAADAVGNLSLAAPQVVVGGTVVKDTQVTIVDFVQNRTNHLLNNQPNIGGFLTGNNFGTAPLGYLNAHGNDNEMTLAFSSSLSALTREDNQRVAEAFANFDKSDGKTDEMASKVDIWSQIYGAQVTDKDTKSKLWVGYLGAHYFVSEDLLVGVLGQIDWSDESDAVAGSSADGFGWMVGPYLAGKIPDQDVFYEARIAWGKSENEVSPYGTHTDNFETERWMVSAKINGAYKMGGWLFSPEASLSWFEETQLAYTDSLTNLIPEQTVSVGEFRFGPNVAYDFDLAGGLSLRPSIGISGVTNFGIENNAAAQSSALGNNDIRARIDSGLLISNPGAWSFSLNGFYDGIGLDDYEAYGGTIKLSVPLH